MEAFSKCPSYVPRLAVESVRELLLDLERGGSSSFADFKRHWEASELPALLYEAIQRSSRATAGPATGRSGRPDTIVVDADNWDKRLSVRQLYAAAASFLAGMWVGDEADKHAQQIVQVGAVFALFCLYWGQPVHTREPIPLTPSGWKHVLLLCEIAKVQGSAESAMAPGAQHQICGALEEQRGAGGGAGRLSGAGREPVARLDLADFRRAYAQLHGAGAFTFCCAPAPLEDESFRRLDIRDPGVWSNSSMLDLPSQRNSEQNWQGVIGESNDFLDELQAKKEAILQTFDKYMCDLSSELQSYAEAKEKLRQEHDALKDLVPNYVDQGLHSTLHTLLNPRPRPAPRPQKDTGKQRKRVTGVDVLQRAMDDFDQQTAHEPQAQATESNGPDVGARRSKTSLSEHSRTKQGGKGAKASMKGRKGSSTQLESASQTPPKPMRMRLDDKAPCPIAGEREGAGEGDAEVGGEEEMAGYDTDMLEAELEMDDDIDDATEESGQGIGAPRGGPPEETAGDRRKREVHEPFVQPSNSSAAAQSAFVSNVNEKDGSKAACVSELERPCLAAQAPRLKSASDTVEAGTANKRGRRGRGRGPGGRREEEDFIDVDAGLRRLEHSRTHFGAAAPSSKDVEDEASSDRLRGRGLSAASPAAGASSTQPKPFLQSPRAGDARGDGGAYKPRGIKQGSRETERSISRANPPTQATSSRASASNEKDSKSDETARQPSYRRDDLRVGVPSHVNVVSHPSALADANGDSNFAQPRARSSSSRHNSSSCPSSATAHTPTFAPASARAPAPSSAMPSAKAPTPASAPASARAPTPSSTTSSAKAPTPASAPASARAPTPSPTTSSAKAPTPASAPASARAPTPSSTTSSAKAPTPASAPASARAPTPSSTTASLRPPTSPAAGTPKPATIITSAAGSASWSGSRAPGAGSSRGGAAADVAPSLQDVLHACQGPRTQAAGTDGGSEKQTVPDQGLRVDPERALKRKFEQQKAKRAAQKRAKVGAADGADAGGNL